MNEHAHSAPEMSGTDLVMLFGFAALLAFGLRLVVDAIVDLDDRVADQARRLQAIEGDPVAAREDN